MQENLVYAIMLQLKFDSVEVSRREKKRGPLNNSGPILRGGWVLQFFCRWRVFVTLSFIQFYNQIKTHKFVGLC